MILSITPVLGSPVSRIFLGSLPSRGGGCGHLTKIG
jgi:hypothetical protein